MDKPPKQGHYEREAQIELLREPAEEKQDKD